MTHCSWSNSVSHPFTVQESVTVFGNVYYKTSAKLLTGVNFESRRWYFFARFYWACGFVSRFRSFSTLVLQGFVKIWELCTNIKYRWVFLMIVTYRRNMHNTLLFGATAREFCGKLTKSIPCHPKIIGKWAKLFQGRGEHKIACQHDKVEANTGNWSLHLFEHLQRNEK